MPTRLLHPSKATASSLIHPDDMNPVSHFHLQHHPNENNEVSSSPSVLHSPSSLSVHLSQKQGLKKGCEDVGQGKPLLNTGMLILRTAGAHSHQ